MANIAEYKDFQPQYEGQRFRVSFPSGDTVYGQAKAAFIVFAEDGSVALSREATAEEIMRWEELELLRHLNNNFQWFIDLWREAQSYPRSVREVGR